MKTIVKLALTGLLVLGMGTVPFLPAKDPSADSTSPASAVEAAQPDPALAEKLKQDYSLDTCVVSGDKLGGSMGEAVDYFFTLKTDEKKEIRLVRFCCKDCIKKFKKDTDKYLKKIEDAAKAKAAAKP